MTATVLKLMQETDGQSVLMASHGAAMATLARGLAEKLCLDKFRLTRTNCDLRFIS